LFGHPAISGAVVQRSDSGRYLIRIGVKTRYPR
jgi:hypothetical protein